MNKVMYFTAGNIPSAAESSEIASIEAGRFNLVVRNGAQSLDYLAGPEGCDYVAGSVPDIEPYRSIPLWSPGSSNYFVRDASSVAIPSGGNVLTPSNTIDCGTF